MVLASGATLNVVAIKMAFGDEHRLPWHSEIHDDVYQVIGGKQNVRQISKPRSLIPQGTQPSANDIFATVQMRSLVNQAFSSQELPRQHLGSFSAANATSALFIPYLGREACTGRTTSATTSLAGGSLLLSRRYCSASKPVAGQGSSDSTGETLSCRAT